MSFLQLIFAAVPYVIVVFYIAVMFGAVLASPLLAGATMEGMDLKSGTQRNVRLCTFLVTFGGAVYLTIQLFTHMGQIGMI